MSDDRIKLAEAMGWKLNDWDDATTWERPDGTGAMTIYMLPDPFTSVDDDYAVLEWMRSFNTYEYLLDHDDRWVEFIVALDASDNGEGHKACYQIGDYARAALKVIAEQETAS